MLRAWYGMEWNGTEISVWNMEDARMEWNGRQSSILPYQFHTILIDFAHGIYRKIYKDSDNLKYVEAFSS